jgi:murein L,D-transpeptidase YafK
MMKRFLMATSLTLALAACQDFDRSSRHLSPIPPATLSLMAQKGMSKSDPIVIRSYKKESEMEIWKRGSDGRFALLKTYPICRWSGQLGPKVREGDRQAPEGFYTITPAQMNPNSSYFLSFDTGYPNAYDRSLGHTGSNLMVHGSCSSRGCFAMTDETIAEVYALARESFAGGQRTFQFQSYPFRMTAKNLAQHRYDPNMPFWRNLKEGSDYFEVTRAEPKAAVCGKRYVFGGADVAQGNCSPAIDEAVAQKRERDEQEVAELVASGVEPIKLVYDDGGQHNSFRQALADGASGDTSLVVDARSRNRLGDVSRPEALAAGPKEIILDASGKPKQEAPPAALAFASGKSAASAAPASQKPAAVTASAAGPQPVATEPKPFYQRMFNGIGDLLGATSAPAAEAIQTTPAATSVAPAPRGSVPAAKPRAAIPDRTHIAAAN